VGKFEVLYNSTRFTTCEFHYPWISTGDGKCRSQPFFPPVPVLSDPRRTRWLTSLSGTCNKQLSNRNLQKRPKAPFFISHWVIGFPIDGGIFSSAARSLQTSWSSTMKTHICQERQSFVQDGAISCCVLLFTTGPSWKATIP